MAFSLIRFRIYASQDRIVLVLKIVSDENYSAYHDYHEGSGWYKAESTWDCGSSLIGRCEINSLSLHSDFVGLGTGCVLKLEFHNRKGLHSWLDLGDLSFIFAYPLRYSVVSNYNDLVSVHAKRLRRRIHHGTVFEVLHILLVFLHRAFPRIVFVESNTFLIDILNLIVAVFWVCCVTIVDICGGAVLPRLTIP
jgi:hypothetical protein